LIKHPRRLTMTNVSEHETLKVGRGGWLSYSRADLGMEVFVRFVDVFGRLTPIDLVLGSTDIEASPVLDASLLRRIPVARIEAWANSGEVVEAIRKSLSQHGGPAVRQVVTDLVRRSRTTFERSGEEDDLRLEVPTGRNHGDDFYRAVAAVYGQAAAASNGPAPRIAAANNVSVAAVHRWVNEARKRGFLAPAVKGRAG
jgi:hypothetical protein